VREAATAAALSTFRKQARGATPNNKHFVNTIAWHAFSSKITSICGYR
jgi:hypothetical protein